MSKRTNKVESYPSTSLHKKGGTFREERATETGARRTAKGTKKNKNDSKKYNKNKKDSKEKKNKKNEKNDNQKKKKNNKMIKNQEQPRTINITK